MRVEPLDALAHFRAGELIVGLEIVERAGERVPVDATDLAHRGLRDLEAAGPEQALDGEGVLVVGARGGATLGCDGRPAPTFASLGAPFALISSACSCLEGVSSPMRFRS
jgi:hypothetical protein